MRWSLAVLAASLLSCGGPTEPEIPDDADLVPFDSLNGLFGNSRTGSQWNAGQARLALRSQAEWAAVYTQATGDPDAQEISFTPSPLSERSGSTPQWCTSSGCRSIPAP